MGERGVVRKDDSLCGGPESMPMDRRRSGGEVRLRSVSGICGEGEEVLLMGTEVSGAPAWCWRQ